MSLVRQSSLIIYLREVARDVWELLPVAAFIFISAIPSQALAFVEEIELSHQPLIFEIDPSLEKTAIIGIEKFPKFTTAGRALRSRSSQIPDAAKVLVPGMAVRVLATAYSSSIDQTDGDPFTTAAGTRVNAGTLAANFLPLGSRVRIGNIIYTVLDRMNSRYNGKYIVDKWVPTRAEAIQFGVRVVELEIVSLP